MQSAFDGVFPIVDISSQLNAIDDGVIYLNNFRDPKLIKELVNIDKPKFRFIHDHYLTCPRSSKSSPITNETCTKKVGLSCFTCPGVVSVPDGKLKIRTPWQTLNELKLHNQFTGIIVSSTYLQKEMVRNGLHAKRISINPIYQSGLGKQENSSKARHPKNSKNLLYVGSLIKGKGVDLLIKSLSKIDIEYHLTIAGDGAWRSKLEQLALNTSMKSKIKFIGAVGHNELSDLYKSSRAVIVPSTLPETFSKAGADALHFGTLPICADVGGISSWLNHGKNGVLFEGGVLKQ